MKKIWMVFIVLVFLFCLAKGVFAGSIYVEYEPGDEKTSDFAEKLILEFQKKENIICQFAGDYTVNVYLGDFPYPETGETKSVVGIFLDKEKKSVFRVWHDELFSERVIKIKAEEAVGRVFERIRKLDIKKRKKIMEIPV